MKMIKGILIFSVLCLFLVNACSSQYPSSNPLIETKGSNSPTPVVVRILDLDTISKTLTPLESSTFTPVVVATQQVVSTPTQVPPTQTQSPLVTSVSSQSSCTNQAKFIRNLTINDNTALEGGISFAKIWRIENVGTCTWSMSYSLVFSGGETMGGSLSTSLSQEVKPGEIIDLRLNLISPLYAQPYTGNWLLQDAAGNLFGIGEQFNLPLSVTIVVKPPVTPNHL